MHSRLLLKTIHKDTQKHKDSLKIHHKMHSKQVVYFCFLFLFVLLLSTVVYFGQLVAQYSFNLPPIATPFERKLPESTVIYDNSGEIINTIFSTQNRIYVPLAQIPQTMRMAMLAAEDINFYTEDGINPQAIIRSALHDVFSNQNDSSLQGASTITQQLVKYTSLEQSRTIERKIKELILTLKISQKYSKDQILEAYLNAVSFGGTNYGIEAASRAYFGKDVTQLDLAQSAFLAGLPQAPSVYAPTYDPQTGNLAIASASLTRQAYVLDQMLKYKNITGVSDEEIADAKTEALVFSSIQPKYMSFDSYIKGQLYNMFGDKIYSEGYKVYTTLDPKVQDIAQATVVAGVKQVLASGFNAHNASLVALDATNGNVIAMVGSVNYNDTSRKVAGNINMAVSPVSPGSSVKPFVYIGAFENGMTPDTKLQDVKTTFPSPQGPYIPLDWDDKFEGDIPLKQALLESRNIPAVETASKIGLNHVYLNLTKAGLPLGSQNSYGLSLAIGGCEVPLLDHTGAYSVLSQDGIKHPVRSILSVSDKHGVIVMDNTKLQSSQVFNATYVKQMNSILKQYHTLYSGSKSIFTINNVTYTVAGKTGTGQDNLNNLFMGYSSHLAVGVWSGNTDQSPTSGITFGEDTAAPMWNTFMKQVLPMYPENSNF